MLMSTTFTLKLSTGGDSSINIPPQEICAISIYWCILPISITVSNYPSLWLIFKSVQSLGKKLDPENLDTFEV